MPAEENTPKDFVKRDDILGKEVMLGPIERIKFNPQRLKRNESAEDASRSEMPTLPKGEPCQKPILCPLRCRTGGGGPRIDAVPRRPSAARRWLRFRTSQPA